MIPIDSHSQNISVPPNERIPYIDTAKGIGLVLLVLGHIATGNSYLFNWIFSFHMPLFFFLSGMCAKEYTLNNFPSYIKKHVQKRLIPYFIIVLAGFFICMIIPVYREAIFADGAWIQLSHIFLYMRPINLYIGQVWFLVALFWAEIYFYFWYKICGRKNIVFQLITALFLIPIANNLWRIQPLIPITGRIPFLMDTACMGAFCYILGFLTSRCHFPEKWKKWGWILILPLLLCNIYFGTWKNGYVNLCNLVYGNSMWYYVISMLSGTGTILLISFYLPKLPLAKWYGTYSLPLFASHTFLIYLIREIVWLFTGTYYTMMEDVPHLLACIMTASVMLLFIPVGKLYQFCCNLKHHH